MPCEEAPTVFFFAPDGEKSEFGVHLTGWDGDASAGATSHQGDTGRGKGEVTLMIDELVVLHFFRGDALDEGVASVDDSVGMGVSKIGRKYFQHPVGIAFDDGLNSGVIGACECVCGWRCVRRNGVLGEGGGEREEGGSAVHHLHGR